MGKLIGEIRVTQLNIPVGKTLAVSANELAAAKEQLDKLPPLQGAQLNAVDTTAQDLGVKFKIGIKPGREVK